MTTSGSYDFAVNGREIVETALTDIGVLEAGETMSAEDLTFGLRKLNLLAKQWMGSSDFAPGLKMWCRKRGYVFLADGQVEYTLGPAGDHTARSYTQTATTAAASLGASTITVTSITGISTTNNIGIELADGTIQWTTVNGAPAGVTVTLTATLTGAVNSGAVVFVYADKIIKPLSIVTMVRRDKNGDDSEMTPTDVYDYESLADKNSEGTPLNYYYEQKRLTGSLFIDSAPTEKTDVLRIVYLVPPEDFDINTDDADFPQIWHRALVYQLAMDLAPSFGKSVTQEMKLLRDESAAIARSADPENSSMFFQPGAE